MAAGVRLGLLKRSLLQYSIAGDDSVTEGVTDLVRGTLCPALKALFEHGLKKPSLLGGACHPWLFIEEVITVGTWSPQSFPGFLEERWKELAGWGWWWWWWHVFTITALTHTVSFPPQAAGREVERDFDSVYSRLVLCKTYRYIHSACATCQCPARQPVMALLFLQVG